MENNKKEVKKQFVVNIYVDDTFSVDLAKPEDSPETQQDATVADVYQWAHQLIKEIDDQRLVERFASTLVQLLTPPQEASVPDVISEKLAERGIKPESSEETA
jgi:hypothetical protein